MHFGRPLTLKRTLRGLKKYSSMQGGGEEEDDGSAKIMKYARTTPVLDLYKSCACDLPHPDFVAGRCALGVSFAHKNVHASCRGLGKAAIGEQN